MDPIDSLKAPSHGRDSLDAALARTLRAPPLPGAFSARLHAAVQRDASSATASRQAAEAEWQTVRAHLRAAGRRLGLTVVGGVAAAAIVPAVLLTTLLPWIRASYGPDGVRLIPIVGAAAGLAIAWAAAAGRVRLDA